MKDFFKVLKKVFFFILLIALTPLLIIEGIINIVKKHKRKKKWQQSELDGKKMLATTSLTDIDIMDGYMFEDYLKILFFYMGYKSERTQKSRDYGADLVLTDNNNAKIVVQAKRYSKPVGSKAVQEILAAKLHYKANEAWVVTNNTFTPQAELLAKENQIRLIDRNELKEMCTMVCNNIQVDTPGGKIEENYSSFKDKYPYYI